MQTSQEICRFIATLAKQLLGADRVILFGSRARGDHRERSDFDIAVSAPLASHEQWAVFATTAQDSTPTLCKIDLLWLQDDLDSDILQRIDQEGRLIS